MPDDLPPAADLFGREVVSSGGARLGRVEIVVRLPDGERQAVVQRGLLRRRRFLVSLAGASLMEGMVVVDDSEGYPHRAA
jgi:hypothetical protein